MPVGAVVIRQHHIQNGKIHYARFIKVREHGGPQQKWRPYARWWWEKNKGPIPMGHRVLHRDGDDLNDDPKNLMLGTPGMNLDIVHKRNADWSRKQHQRAAAGIAEFNRKKGRINRARNFLKEYWYPVVDELGVILNIPFRRRKRLLACFGADVSRYPANGTGKRRDSVIVRLLASFPIKPSKGSDFENRRYVSYCLLDPASGKSQGPMSGSLRQLVDQLDRMKVWAPAVKYARKDLQERK